MELIEFIKEHNPKFEQRENEWGIFTVQTQWVRKPTLEEALEFCYYVIEENPIMQYPTLSELIVLYKEGKLKELEKGEFYAYRLFDKGYHPNWTTAKELDIMCDENSELNKGWRKAETEFFWGKSGIKIELNDKNDK